MSLVTHDSNQPSYAVSEPFTNLFAPNILLRLYGGSIIARSKNSLEESPGIQRDLDELTCFQVALCCTKPINGLTRPKVRPFLHRGLLACDYAGLVLSSLSPPSIKGVWIKKQSILP